MCLILDASEYGNYLDRENEDMRPVREWMKKGGKMVQARAGKAKEELDRCTGMKEWLAEYGRKGQLKTVAKDEILQAKKEIQEFKLESNDRHILALARAAKVTLLVSLDEALGNDFQKPKIINGKGKIYKTKKHKHLLYKSACP